MGETKYIENKNTNNDEIDLIEVALKIWAERTLILKTVAVFFVLGIIIAFGSKKEYKSECTFILDDNKGGSRVSGLLSQFGGLAGINLGGMESEGTISPDLYPNIVQSTPFLLGLLSDTIKVEKLDTAVTVYHFFDELDKPSLTGYIKGYTIGLPGKILGLIRKKNTETIVVPLAETFSKQDYIKLTQTQEDIVGALRERISISLDETSGILTLSVEMPDPVAAAEVARKVYNDLMVYLIDYKIDKAQADHKFIAARHEEARERYEREQEKLASFRDQNKNVTSAYFQTEEERMNANFQLAFNVYNGLAQQLEQSKIKVQEAMPVFKVVNPVKVPLEKSKPKRSMILVVMIFLGGFLGIGIVFGRMMYQNFKP
jgi:uncharacterized protein involved in exopolysaccharide biosynthesis